MKSSEKLLRSLRRQIPVLGGFLAFLLPFMPSAMATNVVATPVASGLASPWAVAFLPQGKFLVTERSGRMRIIAANGAVGAPLAGVPAVAAGGQGGLLDVITDARFADNRRLYFCYAEPATQEQGRSDTSSTALAQATLAADERSLTQVKVLFSQQPQVSSALHFGCRIAQNKAGEIFLALGERFQRKEDAQTLDNHLGKVVRLAADGSVPADNPWRQTKGALPEIWSHGHRNPQGMAFAPDGQLWLHEHGPQGGDEVNRVQAGRNYGWPVITYGENYGGGRIGEGSAKAGMEQPLHYWVPSIAPSGMAFVTSTRYGPEWKNHLFVGSLKFGSVHRLQMEGGKVLREERVLQRPGARIRDVRQGPDGLLYVLTEGAQGQLLRLDPVP